MNTLQALNADFAAQNSKLCLCMNVHDRGNSSATARLHNFTHNRSHAATLWQWDIQTHTLPACFLLKAWWHSLISTCRRIIKSNILKPASSTACCLITKTLWPLDGNFQIHCRKKPSLILIIISDHLCASHPDRSLTSFSRSITAR